MLDDPFDREAVIQQLYDEVQASLKILAKKLARERHPEFNALTLYSIDAIHQVLQSANPSLMRRH